MALIYEKNETEEKIVYKFKHLFATFIVALIVLFLGIAPSLGLFEDSIQLRIIFMVFFAVLGFAMLDFRFARLQIRQAKTEGKKVSSTGSKFSFSNPYTVEISKK